MISDYKKVLFILFLTVTVSIELFSQTAPNPFYGGKTDQSAPVVRKPLFRNSAFYNTIAAWQKTLRDRIAQFILSLKKGENESAIFIILGISFIYGVIHALGPGHRKTVMFSYFIAHDARPVHGIAAGLGLSVLHAGSALTLVLLLYFFVRQTFLLKKVQFEVILEAVSYGSIAVLGFVLFILKASALINKRQKTEGKTITSQQLVPLILAAGLVPCPGASSILIFSLSAGFITIGILGVLVMSFGMAITISAISVAAIMGKKKILEITEKRNALHVLIHGGLELTGACIIFLFGLFMFFPFLSMGRL